MGTDVGATDNIGIGINVGTDVGVSDSKDVGIDVIDVGLSDGIDLIIDVGTDVDLHRHSSYLKRASCVLWACGCAWAAVAFPAK